MNVIPYIFYDNKSCLEYNIAKLVIKIGTSVMHITAIHNCTKTGKRDSSEVNNLQSIFYFCLGAKFMLTSYLWTEIGIHNAARGTVIILFT
jgi:hypothetical protein